MAFDVEGARAAGYSDTEITDFLSTQRRFDVGQARKAGYPDSEILGHMLGGAEPQKPVSVRVGEGIREAGRQVGLTARYAAEGLPQIVDMISAPAKALTDSAYSVVTGRPVTGLTMSQTGTRAADAVGLPSPRTADERVIGDMTRTGFGAASGVGAGRTLASGAQGVAGAVGGMLAASPGTQIAAAVGAGGAGGAVREAGGGPYEQLVASLIGGVAAGAMLPAAAVRAGNMRDAIVARFGPTPPPQAIDLQINLALQRQGIDYAALAGDVRAQLRAEVTDALRTGGALRPEVLGRLADYRTVGATPLRGSVTLDPSQITRERNLAKVGANSTDVNLQRLPRVQNENNRALINRLNDVGAGTTDSPVAAGNTLTGSIERVLGAERGRVDDLYNLARDSQGRSFPLNGTFFSNRVDTLLGDELVMASLPPDVRNRVNQIALGEMPFTVDVAEMLKTKIGNLQRASSDGSVRTALRLVRQAIDETPVLPLGQQSGPVGAARAVNPQGLPSVAGSTDLGEQGIAAFNQARAANRAMMNRIESTPALQAVYDGVEPDKFVAKFITGQGREATLQSLTNLRTLVQDDPQALATIRSQIAAHLKGRAINDAADEVGNFSYTSFNKALDGIGREKLALFFSREELAQLEAVRRVAGYENFQPRGAAVNNSNSAAAVTSNALDFLDRVANRVPVVGSTIQGLVRGAQQTNVLNTSPALTQPAQSVPLSTLIRQAPRGAIGLGGMFGLPALPGGEDERR